MFAILNPGDLVYFNAHDGSDNPVECWLDADRSVAAPRPLVANSAGRIMQVWFKPGAIYWPKVVPGY